MVIGQIPFYNPLLQVDHLENLKKKSVMNPNSNIRCNINVLGVTNLGITVRAIQILTQLNYSDEFVKIIGIDHLLIIQMWLFCLTHDILSSLILDIKSNPNFKGARLYRKGMSNEYIGEYFFSRTSKF